MKNKRDWMGRSVTKVESPSDRVLVWEIEPHYDRQYSHGIARDYQDAVEFAKTVVERLMDSVDPDVIRHEPIEVKIRLIEMTVEDIDAAEDGDMVSYEVTP
ncbi:MAG: hypothetical protein AB7G11_02270 [Phycisphaerales bacterium]